MVPQAPQLFASLVILISQPSVCLLLLQSAKPLLQSPLQTPPPHEGVMLLLEHTVPHAPQSLTVVIRLVSHPSICLLLLQSPQPELQTPPHTPPAHVGTPMLLFEQTMPQPPQLLVVVIAVSQPSVCLLLLQSPNPELQVPLHTPPEPHVTVAMLLLEHTSPQPPQLLVVVSAVSQPSVCLLLLQSP